MHEFVDWPDMTSTVGHTPLVRLAQFETHPKHRILAKLEGNNPAGSVKDRPALAMIQGAQERGEISPGDELIEATSGNTGIALAMAAAMKGYKLTLIMPANASQERKDAMTAYGAKLVEVTQAEGMEGARDLAQAMQAAGKGRVLDQFGNSDNPSAHFRTTGPEIWDATQGQITHFVSAMGTTGTIMGVSRYLKSQNSNIQIVGLQPDETSSIPGIRRWPKAYLPSIFEAQRVDQIIEMDTHTAVHTMQQMAQKIGLFAGVSSGGNVAGAMQVSAALAKSDPKAHAVIVCIICDRGDRYLSTGVYTQT